MKPYGQVKKIKFPGKTDYHTKKLGKNIVNWWELMDTQVSRGRLKQMVRKDIDTQLYDHVG